MKSHEEKTNDRSGHEALQAMITAVQTTAADLIDWILTDVDPHEDPRLFVVQQCRSVERGRFPGLLGIEETAGDARGYADDIRSHCQAAGLNGEDVAPLLAALDSLGGVSQPNGASRGPDGSSQDGMPQHQRERAVRAELKRLCAEVAETLDQDHREDAVLQSYICARGFAEDNNDLGEFTNSFLPWLEEAAEEYDDEEELNVAQLKQLGAELAERSGDATGGKSTESSGG